VAVVPALVPQVRDFRHVGVGGRSDRRHGATLGSLP
jgi:hypothetical protein